MSEQVTDERTETRSSGEYPSSIAPLMQLGAQALRFDGPEPLSDQSQAAGGVAAARLPPPVSPLRERSRQLAEVSQLVMQIQEQVEELDRRELQVTQRLAELEQEERRFRLTVHQTEQELAERKAALLTQETALAQRLTDFDRHQRDFDAAAEQLDADRLTLEQERSVYRQELQRELDEERQVLQSDREALILQQAKTQEFADALLEQHRTQQSRLDLQLQQEREHLWISLSQEWEEHRARFEQEKAEFLKDRTLLENRLRFQQDHLEKTRNELERDQQAELHERQVIRQRLEDAWQQMHRRKRQLDRYRAALEELDRALDRELELNSRSKAALASTVEQERQQDLAERQAWNEERRQQQAELRRQQELLLTHTENLDARRQRLESLRREVEETNRAALEMRLAVEEVRAQLQQSLGLTGAQDQVDQARRALTGDYEQWQARLQEQQRELHDAERQLEQQRLAFQEERRTLTDWIAARDAELVHAEQLQRRQALEQATEDHALQELRERWLRERAEAEQVIRKLLDDLVDRAADLPNLEFSALSDDVARL